MKKLMTEWRKYIKEVERIADITSAQDEIQKALHNSGCAVRLLHRMAVTHGDLSTNNILIDEDCNAFLIDFGLSAVEYEVERFGIDLHVMDEILGASPPNIDNGIDIFLAGYQQCDEDQGPLEELSGCMPPVAKDVLKRLDDVRSRPLCCPQS